MANGQSTDAASTDASSAIRRDADRGATERLRFLAVVDGRECTNRVVDFVTTMAQKHSATEAVVLNVQEMHANARLRGYDNFKRKEIEDRLVNELGGPIVSSASAWLQRAGVLAVPKVRIGDPVAVILDCAAENACDAIIIGEPQPQGMRRWLAAMRLPLVSVRLAELMARSTAPIVVVK